MVENQSLGWGESSGMDGSMLLCLACSLRGVGVGRYIDGKTNRRRIPPVCEAGESSVQEQRHHD